jgi:hypothetical protein
MHNVAEDICSSQKLVNSYTAQKFGTWKKINNPKLQLCPVVEKISV